MWSREMTPVSTSRRRIRTVQWSLAGSVFLAALVWAAVAVLATFAGASLTGRIIDFTPATLRWLRNIAIALGAGALIATLWRGRFAASRERVALWIEEKIPQLQYALVTAAGLPLADENRFLEAEVERIDTRPVLRRAVAHALLWPLAALVAVSAVLLLASAHGEVAALVAPAGWNVSVDKPAAANRLIHLSARVTAPAYSREPARTLIEPTNIAALVGSEIAVSGNGDASGIVGIMGIDSLRAAEDGRNWILKTIMPARPVVLRLVDRSYRRLLVLEPRQDSIPRVILAAPTRDTTYRVARGRLPIEARMSDDVGLASGYFDFLISIGSGESFTTRTATLRHTDFRNAKGGTIRSVILLDTMKLTPGTVLHLRAIAADNNTLSGPGRGISETRTIRVARADEYDSVSITPAKPLPIDTALISQRMLIMRTESLVVRKPHLERPVFEDRSTVLSQAQEVIRQRVERVIQDLESDGSGARFRTAVSDLLRGASSEMWDARGLLGIAEPNEALPAMRRALVLLQKAREAHRIYLRGLIRQEVVNIERVRMQGTDTAHASSRLPRPPTPDTLASLARRIHYAVRLIGPSRAAAVDSLTFIRVDALTTAPQLAATLSDVIDAIRAGRNPSAALVRARRVTGGGRMARQSLSGWLGGAERP